MILAYYNEIDKNAAEWLRQLIKMTLITDGVVDERSIVDVQANDLKGFDRVHLFAGIGGWEYALKLAGWPDDRPVWTGSAPCFADGTLILTNKGMKEIKDITIGDMVLTHKGRFKKVLQVGWDIKPTITITGQGSPPITTTTNHPFYGRNCKREYSRKSPEYGKQYLTEPEWIPAKDMVGKKWACPITIEPVGQPKLRDLHKGYFFDAKRNLYVVKGVLLGKQNKPKYFKTEQEAIDDRNRDIKTGLSSVRGAGLVNIESLGFAKFLGYWLGDGWVSGDRVVICGAKTDVGLLDSLFIDAGMRSKASVTPTGSKAGCGSIVLSEWLTENFGKGALNKAIPTWLYGMPDDYKTEFLSGYELADGCKPKHSKSWEIRQFTTVSKKIAIGIRILINQLGGTCNITKYNRKPTCVIQGRVVNQKDTYLIRETNSQRTFNFIGGHGWGVVRSVEQSGKIQQVFNLEVEDDNSYVADGITVHNCQSFSVAGKQKGKDDERHLWPEMYRLIRECKPSTVFGEQVEGAIKHGWACDLQRDVEAENYAFGMVILGAHSAGAPHIRQRLYWVANAGCGGAVSGMVHTNGNGSQQGRQATETAGQGDTVEPASSIGEWDNPDWIYCRDNKYRPIKPGTFALVDGLPKGVVRSGDPGAPINADETQEARVMRLKGYGNSIAIPVAVQFISSFMEIENEKNML